MNSDSIPVTGMPSRADSRSVRRRLPDLGSDLPALCTIYNGCFSDPGLEALRELTSIPVVGPGAAALHLAAQLGTRMTIPGYGEGVAADVGSSVRGDTIDLWFPTIAQAFAWGRRTVTITLH